MRFLILVLLFTMSLTTTNILNAQYIEEGIMDMSLGANNGFTLDLPEYDYKFTLATWKDYLKDFRGKTKKVKRSSELFTDDATISYLATGSIDLYSLVEKVGNGSAVNTWFDLGGTFIDTENQTEASEGVELFLNGFKKQLKVEQIKIELSAEEKELKSLEQRLKKLVNLHEKYNKEIENWKVKIAENENKITTNVRDQEDMESAIKGQKDRVKDVEVKLAKAES